MALNKGKETNQAPEEAVVQSLRNAIADPLCVVDTEGVIKAVNAMACSMFLCTEAELLGKNVSALVTHSYKNFFEEYILRPPTYSKDPSKSPRTTPPQSPRREERGQHEIRCLRSDRSTFPAEATCREVQGQKGLHFVILRDITEWRKQMQETSRYETDFEEIEMLGYGGFGTVYRCRNQLDGNIYALKRIPLQKLFPLRLGVGEMPGTLKHRRETPISESTRRQLNEVKMLARISHDPNIVRYHTSWVEKIPQDKAMKMFAKMNENPPTSSEEASSVSLLSLSNRALDQATIQEYLEKHMRRRIELMEHARSCWTELMSVDKATVAEDAKPQLPTAAVTALDYLGQALDTLFPSSDHEAAIKAFRDGAPETAIVWEDFMEAIQSLHRAIPLGSPHLDGATKLVLDLANVCRHEKYLDTLREGVGAAGGSATTQEVNPYARGGGTADHAGRPATAATTPDTTPSSDTSACDAAAGPEGSGPATAVSRPGFNIKDFVVLRRLSGGSFGRVYLVRQQGKGNSPEDEELPEGWVELKAPDGRVYYADYNTQSTTWTRPSKNWKTYALKVISKAELRERNMLARAQTERDIMAVTTQNKISSVVELYCTFQSVSNLYIVMEYCCGGDLLSYLERHDRLEEDTVRLYAAELVLALEVLHANKIVHRDVKPENVLIDARGHLKLTDFGLSACGLFARTDHPLGEYNGEDLRDNNRGAWGSKVGTPDYVAPEVVVGAGHGPPVDWWALGVTIYELFVGVPCFMDETIELIFSRILRREIHWPPPGPMAIPYHAVDLIHNFLMLDPEDRLGSEGVEEIKEHPFFEGIEWDKLLDAPSPVWVPDPGQDYAEDRTVLDVHADISLQDLLEEEDTHNGKVSNFTFRPSFYSRAHTKSKSRRKQDEKSLARVEPDRSEVEDDTEEEWRLLVCFIQMAYHHRTLRQWMDNPRRQVDEEDNMDIFSQIVKGLAFVHQHGIVHRDLKPSNIFLKGTADDLTVALGDFGLAVEMDDNDGDFEGGEMEGMRGKRFGGFTRGVGTALYASPEQLDRANPNRSYTAKADLFALGVILCEMFCPPFTTHMQRYLTLSSIRMGTLPSSVVQMFQEYAELMLQLLQPAHLRPSAAELGKHKLLVEWMEALIPTKETKGPGHRKVFSCTRCDQKEEQMELLKERVAELEAEVARLRANDGSDGCDDDRPPH